MKKLTLATLILTTLLILPWGKAQAFEWLDGKLEARGNIQQTMNIRTHEDVRDIRYSSFRTMFRTEARYKMVQNPDLKVEFYGLGNYYYDWALDIDSPMRHSIRAEAGGRHKYRDLQRPRDSREWLTELYMEVRYKNFMARLGKQLVSWGETAESQVADLINPLDTKYLLAFPDWEDFKLGLWMARLYWTPEDMWQDLAFELVVIPFDYLPTRYPPAGSGLFIGGAPLPGDLMQRVFDKQRRDEPATNCKNFEIGLRVRGYTNIAEGVDWYLSHFYTRLDSALIDEAGGYSNFMRLALGLPVRGDVYTYPFYNSTALSFTTTWNRIGALIKGECAYNTNRDYQYGNAGKIREKDLITTAIQIGGRYMIPYFSEWNRNRGVQIDLTWYQYWMLNHKYNKSTGEYIIGETGKDSTRTKFTLSMNTGFWFDRIIPVFNLVYDTNGNTTVVGALAFQPGDHWSWMASYQQINESSVGRYSDQVVLNMRYEFW